MSGALLEIRDLCKTFDKGKTNEVTAAYHLDLTLQQGECLSIVGESGCGKSTLAKLITMVVRPDSGQILFNGVDLHTLRAGELRSARQKMQMVFQQPMSAISPRMTIGRFMKVPLENFDVVPRQEMDAEVDRLLDMVHLPSSYKSKLPHEVSGGELQRVMIARAMAGRPQLLICDEATSALDVAVQQDVIELICQLQKDTGVACIFITHDLSLVHQVSQKVVVMYRGRIVEKMSSDNIVSRSLHPYTKLLISSVFTVNCDQNAAPDVRPEDASVTRAPESCLFYGRCPHGLPECGQKPNRLEPVPGDEEQEVACPMAIKGTLQHEQ